MITLKKNWNREFDAMIYLKKPKFNKMTEEQKNKAIKFLADFQFHLNNI